MPRSTALLLGLAVSTGGLAVVLPAAPAAAAPVTDYEMPFACGETWTGTTRGSHSPSRNAVDWNRADDRGEPVVASAAGTVRVASSDGRSGYGRYVVIDHGEDESTLYAHLDSVSLSYGQPVDQGALVGRVGSTGNSSGAHLHFEERQGRDVVEPYFSRTRYVFGEPLTSRNCVDVPLAGNLLGGRKAELAVYRRGEPSTFQIFRPRREPKVMNFGAATDEPVLGDWDGDGRVNPGIRTPETRTFTLKVGRQRTEVRFGASGDHPVAGDWDGDGVWEVGVRAAGTGNFRLRNADGSVSKIPMGDRDDLGVTGDWDGDGITDVGIYDQAAATFWLRTVDDQGIVWNAEVPFGEPGDLPVTGDWDGNGTTDVGVWDPATAEWEKRQAASAVSARSTIDSVTFGNPR